MKMYQYKGLEMVNPTTVKTIKGIQTSDAFFISFIHLDNSSTNWLMPDAETMGTVWRELQKQTGDQYANMLQPIIEEILPILQEAIQQFKNQTGTPEPPIFN